MNSAKPKYAIRPMTPVLVFGSGTDGWEPYDTEEYLTFDCADVGKTTLTFRYLGTCLQADQEEVGGTWRNG